MNKDAVRERLLKLRQSQSAVELAEKSKIICEKVYDLFPSAKKVLLYSSIKSEVDVNLLIEKYYLNDSSVYLPSVCGTDLKFRSFNGFENLKLGKFGICEACGADLDCEFDLIVVPAIAYDRQGYRVGYGRGFYDRFLSTSANSVRLGVGFSFQLIENVYPEAHDKPVDIIVTEFESIWRKK